MDAVLATVEDALRRGSEVTVAGFGKFHVSNRGARTGRRPNGATHPSARMRPMTVARIAWLVTVLVALVTALLLLLAGYTAYAGLGVAVAASAAVNLF